MKSAAYIMLVAVMMLASVVTVLAGFTIWAINAHGQSTVDQGPVLRHPPPPMPRPLFTPQKPATMDQLLGDNSEESGDNPVTVPYNSGYGSTYDITHSDQPATHGLPGPTLSPPTFPLRANGPWNSGR